MSALKYKYCPDFTGNPENTSAMDALQRAVDCAHAINVALTVNFEDEKTDRSPFSRGVVNDLIWAQELLLNQARQVITILEDDIETGRLETLASVKKERRQAA